MAAKVDWEQLYERTIAQVVASGSTRPSRRPYEIPADVRTDVRRILAETPVPGLNLGWLVTALADGERRWFAAAVCAKASGSYLDAAFDGGSGEDVPRLPQGSFPSSMLDALARAAVLERDPSFDGHFVRPAIWMFGWAATVDAITRYLHDGTAAEKWGAVNALYHASGAWRPPYGPETIDARTFAAHWRPASEAMLTEFVHTTDRSLQQTIVRWLGPIEQYRPSLRDLARRAHEIARNHSDAFVRRAGTDVDKEGHVRFRPLPSRED